MSKKVLLIAVACIQLATLIGCWDAQDIEELSIPIVGAYDFPANHRMSSSGDERIIVGALFPNLDPRAKKKVRVETIVGATIGDSRGLRFLESSEIFSPGMLQVLLFGEELARNGIRAFTDIDYRNPKVSINMKLAVVEGQANDLLQIPEENTPNLGVFLRNLLTVAQKRAFMPVTTLNTFAIDLYSPGKNPVLPILKSSRSKAVLSGIAIFKKDKMVAKVGLRDARSLVLLRGLKGERLIPFSLYKGGRRIDKGTLDVFTSRKVGVSRQNGRYIFRVAIKVNGRLLEHYSQRLLTKDGELIRAIENAVQSDLETNCRRFIHKMQNEFRVDCINISPFALAKWRNELANQIDDGFIQKVRIIVHVDVHITHTGIVT